jgi:hypothetical protein
VSGLFYADGHFPFCVIEKGPAGEPIAEWDGETYFSNDPSGASDQFIPVVGPLTRNPIGLNLQKLSEFYWMRRFWSLDFVTTGKAWIFPDEGTEWELYDSYAFSGQAASNQWDLVTYYDPFEDTSAAYRSIGVYLNSSNEVYDIALERPARSPLDYVCPPAGFSFYASGLAEFDFVLGMGGPFGPVYRVGDLFYPVIFAEARFFAVSQLDYWPPRTVSSPSFKIGVLSKTMFGTDYELSVTQETAALNLFGEIFELKYLAAEPVGVTDPAGIYLDTDTGTITSITLSGTEENAFWDFGGTVNPDTGEPV